APLLLGLEPGGARDGGDLVGGAAAAAHPGHGVRRVVPAVAVVLSGTPTATPAPRRAALPLARRGGRPRSGVLGLVTLRRVAVRALGRVPGLAPAPPAAAALASTGGLAVVARRGLGPLAGGVGGVRGRLRVVLGGVGLRRLVARRRLL